MLADLERAARVGGDDEAAAAIRTRANHVLRPRGALARLDELAVWLARWQQSPTPSVRTPGVVIFAGNHGVASEGVSAYPQSVTGAMVDALNAGIATAAVMAEAVSANLTVVEVGEGEPCGNIRVEPALTSEQFEEAVTTGRESVSALGDIDLLIPGEVGIGNTTPAAAISTALFGGDVADWVGPGTGLDSDGVERKTRVVQDAVDRVGDTNSFSRIKRAENAPSDARKSVGPVEILRELGGWELAAMAGAVVEARKRSIPVLLDGFVVTSALMPLEIACPGILNHCWPGHVSAEPGHRRLVARLGRRPILDLEMRLGEASGALAALPVLRLAAESVVRVATFEEAGLT